MKSEFGCQEAEEEDPQAQIQKASKENKNPEEKTWTIEEKGGEAMAKAYLKIDVEPGLERAVKEAILQVDGVSSAELTAGEQDLIALVEQGSYEEVLNLVVNKVRGVDGIIGTVTNLVLD